MLEPGSRQLLLDSLRPPPGFSLDRAVGTTFSLDLHALLTAPLAFALFDTESTDGLPDPVALLEAVRRHAERIDIFCQAGQIALPEGQYERVLAYVEPSVHQVVPDAQRHVFHPKVWVLRFLDGEGAVRYRVLCLSRNLTFARSWDTIVSLEGEAAPRRERNAKPLADFVRALPALVPQAGPPERAAAVLELASGLEEVAFAAPAPFREVGFLPLGIKRHRQTSLPVGDGELRLVVSPFVSVDLPKRFSGQGAVTLVSRPESLDALAPELLDEFEPYTLATDAIEPVEDDAEIAEARNEIAAERAGCSLRGLHTKLYLAERGWDASVWTGSANATSAAFGGNVEFLVELRGPRAQCGLESLLGEDGVTFGTLLEPYIRGDAPATETSPEERLAERLDTVRHALAAARFVATVSEAAEADTFGLRLTVTADEPLPQGAEARVWPISLADVRARPLREALAGAADFGAVSFDRLTSFFAVELAVTEDGASARTRFVVNAQLEGAPRDRGDLLLSRLLESREKVLRYLLLLLASDGFAADASGPVTRLLDALDRTNGWQDFVAVPLLESLVRALAREPHRLDHVERLVDSLRRTEEGAALLPEGFEEIWAPLVEARNAAR